MTINRSIVLLIAICGSVYLVETGFLHPKFASIQLVTFVSIISASVLAALNGLVFSKSSMRSTDEGKLLQDKANDFWIAFLYVAISAAFITIVGVAAEWKSLSFKNFKIDIFGDISAIMFSVLFVLIFFDFASMIRHALTMRSKIASDLSQKEDKSFEMPETPKTKY